MKTGTGSAIRCIYASAQALLVAVPVPLFISPDVGWDKLAPRRATAHHLDRWAVARFAILPHPTH